MTVLELDLADDNEAHRIEYPADVYYMLKLMSDNKSFWEFSCHHIFYESALFRSKYLRNRQFPGRLDSKETEFVEGTIGLENPKLLLMPDPDQDTRLILRSIESCYSIAIEFPWEVWA